MGRRAVWKDEGTLAIIVRCLELGMSRADAALAAKIGKSTINVWFTRAGTRGYLRAVCDRIEAAEVECKRVLLERIHVGAIDKPAVAMTLLARKWPDEFGSKREMPDVGGPVNVAVLMQHIQTIVQSKEPDAEDASFAGVFAAAGLDGEARRAGVLGPASPAETPADSELQAG